MIRILFIASKNSLRSEPCHFELSEGRKKYAKTWEDVLFPIHIDNYLFEIQKYQIPPEHRDELWDNICELREINSKDFSKFVEPGFQQEEFDTAIANLVKDLRKNLKVK